MLRLSLATMGAALLLGCGVPTYPTGDALQPLSPAEQQALTAAVSEGLNDPSGDRASALTRGAVRAEDRVLCGRRDGRSRFGGPAGFRRDDFGGDAGPQPSYSWDRTDRTGIGATQSDLRAASPIVQPRSAERLDPWEGSVGCLVVRTPS